jgi:hypothetical protein
MRRIFHAILRVSVLICFSALCACKIGVGQTASPSPAPAASPTPPPTSEGSAAAPVSLILDADHVFTMGTAANGGGSSYYRFTTATAGDHYFSPAWTSGYTCAIFSDSAFSVSVAALPASSGESFLGSLSASTTYYLRLTNGQATAGVSASGRIISAATVNASVFGEGSIASPVSLTLEDEHAVKLGGHLWNRRSYYAFTTGSDGELTLDFAFPAGLDSVAYDLGIDPTFQTFTVSGISSSQDIDPGALSAATPYFLRITGRAIFEGPKTLPLILTGYPTDNIILPLGATAGTTAFTRGDLTSSVQEIKYRVILPNASGGKYCIFWDDSGQGSGTYTANVWVQAYNKGGVSYFSQNSAFNTAQTVPVAAGERAIIIRVIPYSTGGSGSFGIKCVNQSTGTGIIHIQ